MPPLLRLLPHAQHFQLLQLLPSLLLLQVRRQVADALVLDRGDLQPADGLVVHFGALRDLSVKPHTTQVACFLLPS